MSIKHGIHKLETPGRELTSYGFFWMGEQVEIDDFNGRLAGMTASAGKDINMFIQGFQAKKSLNEGQKTVAQLDALEEVTRLPLCPDCRKLIGEAQ